MVDVSNLIKTFPAPNRGVGYDRAPADVALFDRSYRDEIPALLNRFGITDANISHDRGQGKDAKYIETLQVTLKTGGSVILSYEQDRWFADPQRWPEPSIKVTRNGEEVPLPPPNRHSVFNYKAHALEVLTEMVEGALKSA